MKRNGNDVPDEMATTGNMEKELSAVDSIEALLIKLATELPSLVGEINSAGSALKQTNLRSLNSLSTAICDVPVNIAAELQLAAEAAESKHFFTCTQKLKNTSHQLQILMEEAKRTRRKIDFLAAPAGTTALEHHQPLHRQCAYLEQAVSLLYALNLGLHEVQLTANALYVHGLQDAAQPVLATDDLKDAIARLVSIVSTKHFKSTCTTIGSP